MAVAAAMCAALAVSALAVGSSPPRAASATGTITRGALLLGDSLTSETAPVDRAPRGWRLWFIARPGEAPCDWLTEPTPNFYSAIALHPSVVLIETAGNDNTRCMRVHGAEPSIGSPGYLSRYETALSTIFAVSRRDGAVVILLAAPPLLEPHLGAALVTIDHWAKRTQKVAVAYGPRKSVARNDGFALRLRCLPGETKKLGCANGEIPVRTLDGHFHEHFCPYVRDITFGFTCAVYSSGEARWARATMSLLR
jgi:hypothetical protein